MKTKFTSEELNVICNVVNASSSVLEDTCYELGVEPTVIYDKLSVLQEDALNKLKTKYRLSGDITLTFNSNGLTTKYDVAGCYSFTNKQAKHLLRGNIDKFTLKQLKAFHKEICGE